MKDKAIDEKILNDFIKHSEVGMKKFIEWGYRENVDLFLYRYQSIESFKESLIELFNKLNF